MPTISSWTDAILSTVDWSSVMSTRSTVTGSQHPERDPLEPWAGVGLIEQRALGKHLKTHVVRRLAPRKVERPTPGRR